MRCELCPRRCGAERGAGETGRCGAGVLPRIAQAMLHMWEEPCISGTRGSGAVFFSGCTLGCVYCQNHKISLQGYFGIEVSHTQLRTIFNSLIEQGAHNINLVTATRFLPSILRVLEGGLPVPVVWNSGGYERPETLKLLRGKTQIFLPDYKYANEHIAEMLSDAPDYPDTALRAISSMIDIAGPPRYDEYGLMTGGVLVRHLVLPGYLENTRRVLDNFKKEFAGSARLSLMGQYTPPEHGWTPPESARSLGRKLTLREYGRAVEYAAALGLDDVYIQSLDSADTMYTPAFDLSGILCE